MLILEQNLISIQSPFEISDWIMLINSKDNAAKIEKENNYQAVNKKKQ